MSRAVNEDMDRLGACQFVPLKVLIFERAYTHGADFQLYVCPLYLKVTVETFMTGNMGTML